MRFLGSKLWDLQTNRLPFVNILDEPACWYSLDCDTKYRQTTPQIRYGVGLGCSACHLVCQYKCPNADSAQHNLWGHLPLLCLWLSLISCTSADCLPPTSILRWPLGLRLGMAFQMSSKMYETVRASEDLVYLLSRNALYESAILCDIV